MLKFKDIEPMVEYYRKNNYCKAVIGPVRINELNHYQVKCLNGNWANAGAFYNDLLTSTFEPCEWVPKIGETYYYPCYEGYEDKLTNATEWSDSFYDNRIKRNVGIYRTKEEAHAKSIEMGWTL